MKRFYSLVCLIFGLGALSASAQMTVGVDDGGTITIDCGSGSAFEHTFEDDGGGGYGANRNDTVTVCPDGANGSKVTVRINADTENWQIHESDTLYIYDGPDTTWPLMGAYNLATDTNGIVRTASFDNPSGCLTFVFISDGADEGEFVGIIQCGYPCQPFTPYIASDPPADPGYPDTGYIDICIGDTVWMWAQGEFPHSSTNGTIGYYQELDNSTFFWQLADGTQFNGEDTIMVTPSLGAGYDVQLVVTDTLGCPQAGYNKIRVGTVPWFSEVTELLDDTVCYQDTTYLLGGISFGDTDTVGVDPVQGSFLNGGVFTGLTYLPDGSGVEYETTIQISGFDSLQVIEDPSDILEVCLTIEHSYLGDLEMSLTCPDGTEMVMFNSWTGQGISPAFAGGFGGGGTFLGDAADQSQGTPGVGWEYCFSDNAAWGTLGDEHGAGNTVPNTIPPLGNSMTPGTYLPEEAYTSLVGCPINGPWTITVRDNIGTDDGYIFEWGILFNPEIDPNVETYEMQIDSTWWTPDPSIIEYFGDTLIQVSPPTSGDFDFTFNVVDNFGCFHDTTIVVTVDPPLVGTFGVQDTCALVFGLSAADTAILGSWEWEPVATVDQPSVTWSPDSLTGSPTVEVSTPGTYNFMYESACGQRDTLNIVFNAAPDELSWNDTVLCEGAQMSFDALSSHLAVNYDWNLVPQSSQTLSLDSIYQDTYLEVTVSNDCGAETEGILMSLNRISASGPSLGCDLTTDLEATNSFADGVWLFVPPTSAGTATFSPGDDDLEPVIDVDEYGIYKFIYTDDLCGTRDTVEVNFEPNPMVMAFPDTDSICVKDFLEFDAGVFDGVTSWLWEYTPQVGTDYSGFTDTTQTIVADHPGTYSITAFGPCGEASEEHITYEWDCSVVIPNVFNPLSTLDSNKVFMIPNLEFHPGNEVMIFDRWGRKVYEATEYQNAPWDGGKRNSGVYYYVLTMPAIEETRTGYVHLITN